MKASKTIPAIVIMIYFIILDGPNCRAQDDKKVSEYSAGILVGIQSGIGRDAFKTITSSINPWQFEYFSSKRYRNPAARIRLFGDMRVSKIFSMGLQTGATIHFIESYYNVDQNSVSIPLQGALKFEVVQKKKIKAGVNLYSGFNLQRIRVGPYEERSGSLITLELGFKWGRRMNNIFSGGFEYQQDHNRYYFDGSNYTVPLKDEIIKTQTNRYQVYLSYGIGFW